MAKDLKSLTRSERLGYGIGCIALGCYPVAIAMGLISLDTADASAPDWVVMGAGLVFIVAGAMILLASRQRANDFLAAILLLLFGAIAAWASLFSASEDISGGIPLLSHETNVLIARGLFGFGAVLSFVLAVYAVRRATNEPT